jgi:hypothetical protein
MFNLAGKYASDIAASIGKRPIPSALAGAALAGGLATAGNVLTGEANKEEQGRLLTEAIGAGALGAAVGSQIPKLRTGATRALRNVFNVGLQNPGAVARRAEMSPQEIKQAEFARDILNSAVREGIDPAKARADVKNTLRKMQTAQNTVGIPSYLLGAGALGGMVGGGVSNIAQMTGLPGFNQNVIADPELAGSSNTPGARSSTPTLRYIS